MFWNSAVSSSNIDQILDDPEVTLQNVLEQEEILQELKVQNKKLLDFLARSESLNGMIDLITTEPSPDEPLVSQYKLPNVACEVLTSDNSFAEKVTGDKTYLDKLFFFFRDKQPPINPLLSSYVCRVLGEIISRKLDQNWYSYQLNLIQIMGYLQSEEGVLQWLLNHMDCSAVCDFFNKLILNVEGQETRSSLYDWMVEKEHVIMKFMEKMTRNELEDVHANVSRLVGDLLFLFQDDMINSSQDRADCDPFLLALKSDETIKTLMTTLFGTDSISESSVVHGLDLVLSLLGVTKRSPRQSGRNDSLDEDNSGVVLVESVKTELLSHMPILLTLLSSTIDPNPLPMTYGLLKEPVGLGRLAIAKFIAHLFTVNDDELNMGIIKSGVLKQLFDLFWSSPWNNFLHRYVCKIMICIAKSAEISPGSAAFLLSSEMQFLPKLIEVFENKELKCGYRGHLAKVAVVWEEVAFESEGFSDWLNRLKETDIELHTQCCAFFKTLDNYVNNEKVLLAGVHPPASGGLLSSTVGGSSMPNNESDSFFTICGNGGAMQWLAAAQSMMNVDFDGENSLMNLTISGGGDMDDSPSSKAKSIFEMFCNEKRNSYDEDEDEEEEEEDDGFRKKNSYDLSSPESDHSLEEDKWTDAEKKLNLTFNNTAEEDDDDIFAAAEGDKNENPPIPLLDDPWSNLGDDSSNTNANATAQSEDPWNNPDLLFGTAAASNALGENECPVPTETETAAKENSKPAPADEDWANFGNA